MSREPGADERRIRALLIARQVGPDAPGPAPSSAPRLPDWWAPKPHIRPEPTVPPKPTVRPRDWLDDILDTPAPPAEETTQPQPDPEPQPGPADAPQPKPAPPTPPAEKRKRPKPGTPRTAWDTHPPSPRQSLTEAWDAVPYRLRWLGYHATAAAAGWHIGLVNWATNTAAWFAAGHWTASSAWVLYGLGLCAVGLYRRARTWLWPAAWLAAVPVSSTVVGVLLYAPTQ